MKYYAVTKGAYSDYHIITITADAEKAKKIAKKFSDTWDEAGVEEYEEDDMMLRDLWEVDFDDKGNAFKAQLQHDLYYYRQAYIWSYAYRAHPDNRSIKSLVTYVFADSKEAAIKIAAEKRAEYLAEKNGLI